MESIEKQIECVRNETFPSNTYILSDPSEEVCLLIDPGLDHELIDQKLTELQLRPLAILATHGHFDHIGSAAYFKKKFGIQLYMHEADLKLVKSANFYIKMARLNKTIETPTVDMIWKGTDEHLNIGPFKLDVYNYPGHSYGSCVIKYKEGLFSGDIMYRSGLGFNNFPGEDRDKLRNSILKIFDTFPASSLVLPGHGQRALLGVIKSDNIELADFLSKGKL